MGGEIFADDMTVLFRDLRGESSLYIEAFSGRLGALSMMKRISAKKTSALPDIFDDIEASLNPSSSGDLKFVGGFEIRRRRTAIASDYGAFEDAAAIAGVVRRNGRHIEDTARLSARLRRSLDAIDAGMPSQAVRLKFLYLLVRDEGYPVREDFGFQSALSRYARKILPLDFRVHRHRGVKFFFSVPVFILPKWQGRKTGVISGENCRIILQRVCRRKRRVIGVAGMFFRSGL